MPLVVSLVSLVAVVRSRVLDRGRFLYGSTCAT